MSKLRRLIGCGYPTAPLIIVFFYGVKMALPKVSYTQISNEYIDKYMPNLSKEATNIFIAISRKTIGWHKETDRISYGQLLEMTNIKSVNGIKKAIKELKDKDIINIVRDGKGKGIKTYYEINFISCDDISYDDTKTNNNISCHDIKNDSNISCHDTTKDNNIKKEYKDILSFWNSQNIIKHSEKVFLTYLKKKHKDKINLYGVDKVKEAIKSYSLILKSDKYYWSYKWSLWDFLQRGLDKFIAEANPFENYKKKNIKSKKIRVINAKTNQEEWIYEDELEDR